MEWTTFATKYPQLADTTIGVWNRNRIREWHELSETQHSTLVTLAHEFLYTEFNTKTYEASNLVAKIAAKWMVKKGEWVAKRSFTKYPDSCYDSFMLNQIRDVLSPL